MHRYCLVGPTHPYRGGIAHYMTFLARFLTDGGKDVLFLSFSRQYPTWLFPGRSDRDPSQQPVTVDAEYLLDPVNPLSWRRTVKRIAQFQAEVVIIPWWVPYWAPAWSIIGRRIKKLAGPPKLIYICHNVYPHERSRWDRAAARRALSPGDGFVVHAESDKRQLLDLLPGSQVRVTPLPSYSDLGNLTKAPLPAQVPTDKPLLLFCGFVRPYKGLDILLDALPAVLKKEQVHLLIAGEFWEGGAAYREQIQELGVGDSITIIDRYLPNEELAACVDQAAVIVLPYRSATQSAIVQLAFGLHTPVITTDVGGLSESVAHEKTGLVVPPEDPEALAEAIVQFFEQNLGPGFEENIRSDTETFSWQRLVDQLEGLANPVFDA
jgi:glycosyltransferase involved in cell wall biosynthesis